jgi:hypothetical protein
MNGKRFIGFVFVLAGILAAMSRIVLTGAVIGETRSSFVSIIGALVTILGILLVMASREDAKRLEEDNAQLS